jgi:hypothetical protein
VHAIAGAPTGGAPSSGSSSQFADAAFFTNKTTMAWCQPSWLVGKPAVRHLRLQHSAIQRYKAAANKDFKQQPVHHWTQPNCFPNPPHPTHCVTDLVLPRGYPLQKHQVVTEDGAKLSVYRIPAGAQRNTRQDVRKPVVFLQHGVTLSSNCYVLLNQNESMAFILADAGGCVGRISSWPRQHGLSWVSTIALLGVASRM